MTHDTLTSPLEPAFAVEEDVVARRLDLNLAAEIRGAPGWASLSQDQQREFLSVVSQLAQGRQLVGGWRAIADVLGVKRRQVYSRLEAWRNASLISESSGSSNDYDERRRHTFRPGMWTILPETVSLERSERMREIARTRNRTRKEEQPHSTRVRAQRGDEKTKVDPHSQAALDACLPALSKSLSIRGERIEQAGIEQQQLSASRPIVREQASSPALDSLAASYTPQDEVGRQANENIARLEMKVGRPITGRGREILFAALIENPQGVLACWKQRAEHGDNPIGLLLHLLELGEHRTRVLAQTYPRCLHCGHESSDVHDVAPDLRARGTYPEGEYPMCDSCAEHFPNLKDPILGRV